MLAYIRDYIGFHKVQLWSTNHMKAAELMAKPFRPFLLICNVMVQHSFSLTFLLQFLFVYKENLLN